MKNNMLNKLKSNYEELEIKPSIDLWSRLEQRLEENPVTISKKTFEWWKYAAVIVFLISMGTVFYFNSGNDSGNEKVNYIVKKSLEITVNPNNPDLKYQTAYPKSAPTGKSDKELAIKNEKENFDKILVPEKENTTIKNEVSVVEIQQIAVKQPEKLDIQPAGIENHVPVIAEVKKTKPTYINSNELLLGREFDKTSRNPYKNDVKIGIFNFDKPAPNVENVTVLGVTVYVDSK
ncbi:MAG: hypothetical protein ACOVRK_02545 [Chryseobacterium taeanense]